MRDRRSNFAQYMLVNPANVAILIIDREGDYGLKLKQVLAAEGYRVSLASTEKGALELARTESFNIAIKSFDQAKSDGLALMEKLHQLFSETQFIFVGKGGSIRSAIDAIHHGAFDYLAWPAEDAQILRSVRQALEHQAVVTRDPVIRRRLRKRTEVDIFAGASTAMKDVERIIAQVAPTDVTVLIEGESGTGKELVARALHHESLRRQGPFIAVNCAALPETLIESEFFGHVRGAFTGATADKQGRFELARGGTLFLDEIGDLSLLGQADLLRVLDDGVFRPIGSRSIVHADVRIIAATNRDLELECARGTFREDLLYRLNVITIRLRPLRERPEDIPPLVGMFSTHFAARHKSRPIRFSPKAMARLKAFHWPGNIRQLRNLVERLSLTAPHAVIEPEDLPAFPEQAPLDENSLHLPKSFAGLPLAFMEKEMIRITLEKTRGNRTQAAALLGLSRRALQYKLRDSGGDIDSSSL